MWKICYIILVSITIFIRCIDIDIDIIVVTDFESLHALVCKNAVHGIYSRNVSPTFKNFESFDNSIMSRWYTVTGRFSDKKTGYFTEFGTVNFDQIFDTSIDPVTETSRGYQFQHLPVFNSNIIKSHKLTIDNVALVFSSIYKDCFSFSDLNQRTPREIFDVLMNTKVPILTKKLKNLTKFGKFFIFCRQ